MYIESMHWYEWEQISLHLNYNDFCMYVKLCIERFRFAWKSSLACFQSSCKQVSFFLSLRKYYSIQRIQSVYIEVCCVHSFVGVWICKRNLCACSTIPVLGLGCYWVVNFPKRMTVYGFLYCLPMRIMMKLAHKSRDFQVTHLNDWFLGIFHQILKKFLYNIQIFLLSKFQNKFFKKISCSVMHDVTLLHY